MGVFIHHFVSLYSFLMSVFWFTVFVLFGLLIRKLQFPVKFSVIPLILLLVLTVLRTFVVIEIPGAVIINSEVLYPAVVSILRFNISSHRIFGFPINIANVFVCIWVIVSIFLTARYAYVYIYKQRQMLKMLQRYKRDEHAESILAEIIGYDKNFRIYRSGGLSTAIVTAFNPFIILPKARFSDDELRVILLHEWKHIQDKDHLAGIVVNVICFVFWWNPVVYILRKNFRFVQELKCDQFAVTNKDDLLHYLNGILILDKLQKEKNEQLSKYVSANTFISGGDALPDRLGVLALHGKSRRKRILSNICYSLVVIAMFVASYMFTILPIIWESPYVAVSADDFMRERREYKDILRIEENFLVDNGDGTFSLYIDGQFVSYVYDVSELINWVPILDREGD